MVPVSATPVPETTHQEDASGSGLKAGPTRWEGSRKVFHSISSKYTQDTTEIARGSYRKVYPAWHERTDSLVVVRAEDMSTPQRTAAALRTKHLEDMAGGPFAPRHGFEEQLSNRRRVFSGRSKTCVIISRMAESSLDLTLGALHRLPLAKRRATVRYAAEQVLLDLHRLHSECRMLHNDIKPANCLVAAEGTVHLHDFNLSMGMAEPPTRTLAGTPLFEAPELRRAFRDKRAIPYSQASDMFSTALTLAVLAAPGMGKRATPQNEAEAQASWEADIFHMLGHESRHLFDAAVSSQPAARPSALAFAQALNLTHAERLDGAAFFAGQKQLGERVRARLEVGSAEYRRWVEGNNHWDIAAPKGLTDRT